ncbi:class I SAM-dependent methyltransferase [Nocardia asiatica]|uniref:class I SAM-dependent methyltransferase n=1 Tax=Nocardia asiatica TaxID=209252 RepID=UPI0002F55264|nr:class I SAM-dependent methyltransferase [Nocardia asiatica]
MNASSTGPTEAEAYLARHYRDRFRYGEGTEQILAMLRSIPPVRRWVDLGSGSQTMMWALALTADSVIAVDADPHRLQLLRQLAAAATPDPVHATVAALCGQPPTAFTARCRTLAATVDADCLCADPSQHPMLPAAAFDLVTQFGLLGLCSNTTHFVDAFATLHRLTAPGGWVAGANWEAANATGRVALTAPLYQTAAHAAELDLAQLERVDSADPDFPAVWIYSGTRRRP